MKTSLPLILAATVTVTACIPPPPFDSSAVPISVASGTTASTTTSLGKDPRNTTYYFDDAPVTLVNGVIEREVVPDSASKEVTRYFGNEIEVDLNHDGMEDVALLLQQGQGGTGTFYYVAAAVRTVNGYRGTNAVFLGDRIAPQIKTLHAVNPAQFYVTYADRGPGQSFADEPSVMVSKAFRLDGKFLVEVPADPTPEFQWPASLQPRDGYPSPDAPCRVVGESAATVDLLDDAAVLVGCPDAADTAVRVLIQERRGKVKKVVEGVTLLSIPTR